LRSLFTECVGAHMSQEIKEEKEESKEKLKISCLECDEIFEPIDERNNFCSQGCFLSYHGVDCWP